MECDILYLSKENTESLDESSPIKALLKTTLTSTSNKEILKSLAENSLLQSLVNCIKEKMEECKFEGEEDSQELLVPLKEIIVAYVSHISAEEYLLLANLLLSLFLKENMLGPALRNPTGTKEKQNYTEEELQFLHIISP